MFFLQFFSVFRSFSHFWIRFSQFLPGPTRFWRFLQVLKKTVSRDSDAWIVFLARNSSGYVRSNLKKSIPGPSYDLAKKWPQNWFKASIKNFVNMLLETYDFSLEDSKRSMHKPNTENLIYKALAAPRPACLAMFRFNFMRRVSHNQWRDIVFPSFRYSTPLLAISANRLA